MENVQYVYNTVTGSFHRAPQFSRDLGRDKKFPAFLAHAQLDPAAFKRPADLLY